LQILANTALKNPGVFAEKTLVRGNKNAAFAIRFSLFLGF
jgi:hypothetical protein